MTSSPLASERSRRRMIFPERVFGRLSPKRMSFGLAIGPISLADVILQFLDQLLRFVTGRTGTLQHDEGADRFAGEVVRTAHDRGLGNDRVRDQRRLDLHRAHAVTGHVQHVIDTAVMVK